MRVRMRWPDWLELEFARSPAGGGRTRDEARVVRGIGRHRAKASVLALNGRADSRSRDSDPTAVLLERLASRAIVDRPRKAPRCVRGFSEKREQHAGANRAPHGWREAAVEPFPAITPTPIGAPALFATLRGGQRIPRNRHLQ